MHLNAGEIEYLLLYAFPEGLPMRVVADATQLSKPTLYEWRTVFYIACGEFLD